jgi:hypothetical protein
MLHVDTVFGSVIGSNSCTRGSADRCVNSTCSGCCASIMICSLLETYPSAAVRRRACLEEHEECLVALRVDKEGASRPRFCSMPPPRQRSDCINATTLSGHHSPDTPLQHRPSAAQDWMRRHTCSAHRFTCQSSQTVLFDGNFTKPKVLVNESLCLS